MATIKGGKDYKQKLDEIRRKLGKAKTIKVGFKEGAQYEDGTSVPMIAAINEFGVPSRGQPPRPYFRRMIKEKSSEWPGALKTLLKNSNWDSKVALEQLGAGIAGQLQQSIVELVDPPLAPSTIARKGFDKPLIDTSLMLKSVTHQVI